jgi:hypothetical protein
MGVLRPVIQVLRAAVGHRRQKLAVSDLIAGQIVGDKHPRHIPQTVEQRTENRLAAFGVSPGLHQDVEHVAVLVDRTPQVMDDAVDLHENLIEVPLVGGNPGPGDKWHLDDVERPRPSTPPARHHRGPNQNARYGANRAAKTTRSAPPSPLGADTSARLRELDGFDAHCARGIPAGCLRDGYLNGTEESQRIPHIVTALGAANHRTVRTRGRCC